jgi:hypothetical protein
MRVRIDVRSTAALTDREWDEVWSLTNAFYDTDREYAEERLRAHSRTALFRTTDGVAPVGMASVDVYPVTFSGRKLAVIYTSHILPQERRGARAHAGRRVLHANESGTRRG